MTTRREFIATSAAALVGLTRKAPRPIAGGFVDPSMALGHRLRGGTAFPAPGRTVRAPIVIVGGGIAGLSAAWRLTRRGFGDFVLLEMEPRAGGNSAWGESEVGAYPWAAHYVPLPGSRATLVRELFEDLGVLRGGVWEERALCFDPKERLWLHGEWQPELERALDFRARDRADFRRFGERVGELAASGDFTIPMAIGAEEGGAPRTAALDRLTADAWLRREGLASEALRWYADYACRDDYGALAADTSAWALAHYFAARDGDPGDAGPLTWAEGNGWVVRRLLERLGGRVVAGAPVYRVERRGRALRVLTPDAAYDAESVVFAAPTFVAPYVVEGMEGLRGRLPFVYSPWVTANLTLERWPRELGRGSAPPAWDNVLYDSPSLGYVVATHQSLRAQLAREERTVWTYYLPLAQQPPGAARRTLLARGWRDWVDDILADLARAHPDVRDCVSRVDVRRMGHAMVRPAPGFLTSPERRRLAGPDAGGPPRVFFANSDLSGLSLFEEAQYRGVTAADRALAALGRA